VWGGPSLFAIFSARPRTLRGEPRPHAASRERVSGLSLIYILRVNPTTFLYRNRKKKKKKKNGLIGNVCVCCRPFGGAIFKPPTAPTISKRKKKKKKK
jgi:hypothetical protein